MGTNDFVEQHGAASNALRRGEALGVSVEDLELEALLLFEEIGETDFGGPLGDLGVRDDLRPPDFRPLADWRHGRRVTDADDTIGVDRFIRVQVKQIPKK